MSAPVLLFDGVCNLCEQSVQFILRYERDSTLQFASQQSETGQKMLVERGLSTTLESLVLIEGEQTYSGSDAALRVAAYLQTPWSWGTWLLWIPSVIRNSVYKWIAKNRYNWFGQKEMCSLPTPELQARFLDI